MGENCTALLFVDVAAFQIELHDGNQFALAERFDAQIRVNPCLFCFALDDCMMGINPHWRNNSMHRFE